uniref:Transposase InsH N-terminal domain-containing protein n=1 Tax=Cacopsylla melanoneura TaxID=428564 RepID=A0A8D8SS33_9HEMI
MKPMRTGLGPLLLLVLLRKSISDKEKLDTCIKLDIRFKILFSRSSRNSFGVSSSPKIITFLRLLSKSRLLIAFECWATSCLMGSKEFCIWSSFVFICVSLASAFCCIDLIA